MEKRSFISSFGLRLSAFQYYIILTSICCPDWLMPHFFGQILLLLAVLTPLWVCPLWPCGCCPPWFLLFLSCLVFFLFFLCSLLVAKSLSWISYFYIWKVEFLFGSINRWIYEWCAMNGALSHRSKHTRWLIDNVIHIRCIITFHDSITFTQLYIIYYIQGFKE